MSAVAGSSCWWPVRRILAASVLRSAAALATDPEAATSGVLASLRRRHSAHRDGGVIRSGTDMQNVRSFDPDSFKSVLVRDGA